MSAEAWKKVTVGIAADAASVTDKPTDAVAQARLALDRYHEAMAYDVDEYVELRNALIAAVRAECAAKVTRLEEELAAKSKILSLRVRENTALRAKLEAQP